MDEEAWREAAVVKRFLLLGQKAFPKVKTEVRVFYNEAHLYVGFRCEEPERRKPLTGTGALWRDDEVELWIDRQGKAKSYIQFIVNAGGEWIALSEKGPKQCPARVSVGIRPREWIVEIALPFSMLGGPPRKGEVWRINFCRHRPASARLPRQLITWSPLKSGFNELQRFGLAVFK
ncbi:MAG TPA: hypothetical protein EYP85_16160 [Armatimonadetes bacterium]|nr:hypothetical protein [Armatimonadota bacterium]